MVVGFRCQPGERPRAFRAGKDDRSGGAIEVGAVFNDEMGEIGSDATQIP